MFSKAIINGTKRAVARHAPFLYAPLRDALVLVKLQLWRLSLLSARWRSPRKLILGVGNVMPLGWIWSDYPFFDCSDEAHWARYFSPNSLDALLSEHVFEHLDDAQVAATIALCYRYLKPGATLRAAVPDGNHPDAAYRAMVGLGGPHEHKQLFTAKSFSECFTRAGFFVTLLEYHDEAGNFHETPWTLEGGFIGRSSRHGRNSQHPSLILDARKPL